MSTTLSTRTTCSGLGRSAGALATAVTMLLCVGSARADQFTLLQQYRGHVRFLLAGASMADSGGLDNGVSCQLPTASVTITRESLPSRARLVSAVLYAGGSLIDDGIDFLNPESSRFSADNLRADDPQHRGIVEGLARQAADVSVSFLAPDALAAATLTRPQSAPYVSVYYKDSGAERGNIGFFVTRYDVTDIVGAEGRPLFGTYTVSGLDADVCLGLEAQCSDIPSHDTCATLSAIHTNGAAAFALLLVFEDPSLAPHSISVFEGLTQLFGTSQDITLQTANAISEPPSGALAFFALEGDITVAAPRLPGRTCEHDEFIQVSGDASGLTPPLCLVDDDNPAGNIFNSTINVRPANPVDPTAPVCSRPDAECCRGDGMCGVTGVDIDSFDISSALATGERTVHVEVGTGSDRVALATLVLGVDVFEPVLSEDSQVRVLGASDGRARIGQTLEYLLAVSNTGNVPASNVVASLDAPPGVDRFEILHVPESSDDLSSASGGASGTGQARVQGFAVEPGEIQEIRFRVRVRCEAAGASLETAATVSSHEVDSFSVAAPTLAAGGPGAGSCEGIDLGGPFATDLPRRVLRGGGAGGCRAAVVGENPDSRRDENNGWVTLALLAVALGFRMAPRRATKAKSKAKSKSKSKTNTNHGRPECESDGTAAVRGCRESSFPRTRESRNQGEINGRWIPASAGMTSKLTYSIPSSAGMRSGVRFATLPNGRGSVYEWLLIGGIAAVCGSGLIFGCGDRHHAAKTPAKKNPTPVDVDEMPGEACLQYTLMARVRDATTGLSFCVDRFEANLDNLDGIGRAHQGEDLDDTDVSTDGSTAAKGEVTYHDTPTTGITWYQAKAACANAGKRLCTRAEWELACRGPNSLLYPYGDVATESACNGFFNFAKVSPLRTGSLLSCASAWGIFDLSGNVEEWVDAAVPRLPGTTTLTDRLLRGGSFRSNNRALSCVGDEFHAPPGTGDADRGFRCCADDP